ncbi:MAG: hypothetical protein ACR5K7_02130 [Symbiopectobacterium sp.]
MRAKITISLSPRGCSILRKADIKGVIIKAETLQALTLLIVAAAPTRCPAGLLMSALPKVTLLDVGCSSFSYAGGDYIGVRCCGRRYWQALAIHFLSFIMPVSKFYHACRDEQKIREISQLYQQYSLN